MLALRMRKRWMSLFLVMVLLLAAVAPAATARPMQETTPYLVGFHRFPGQAEEQLLKAYDAEIIREFSIIPTVVVRLPAGLRQAAREALEKNPLVDYIEPDIAFYASADSWGVDRVRAPQAWLSTRGEGVNVAILDTGIDNGHPNLNVYGGWNALANNADYLDRNGHGTHVAGTVAAANLAAERTVGLAPLARLYAVKVLGDDGSGTASSVTAGIEWAVQNGMNIINMSLGSSADSTTIRNACDAAYRANVLLVASAGNSGKPGGNGDNVSYPARYESVIAVAATDETDRRASFSSTGPAVELAAPGVRIISTYLNSGYASANGTSMASPHVAGVAALAWANNPHLTNAQLRQRLQNTATSLGRGEHFGYGLVNAAAAVATPEPPGEEPEPNPDPPATAIMTITQFQLTTSGGKNNDRHLTLNVALENQTGSPVDAASVSTILQRNGQSFWSGTLVTGSDGTATITFNNAPSGSYAAWVTDVTAQGQNWDGSPVEAGLTK